MSLTVPICRLVKLFLLRDFWVKICISMPIQIPPSSLYATNCLAGNLMRSPVVLDPDHQCLGKSNKYVWWYHLTYLCPYCSFNICENHPLFIPIVEDFDQYFLCNSFSVSCQCYFKVTGFMHIDHSTLFCVIHMLALIALNIHHVDCSAFKNRQEWTSYVHLSWSWMG